MTHTGLLRDLRVQHVTPEDIRRPIASWPCDIIPIDPGDKAPGKFKEASEAASPQRPRETPALRSLWHGGAKGAGYRGLAPRISSRRSATSSRPLF